MSIGYWFGVGGGEIFQYFPYVHDDECIQHCVQSVPNKLFNWCNTVVYSNSGVFPALKRFLKN